MENVKKTIISILVVILFAVFVQEKIVEQDIRKAIVLIMIIHLLLKKRLPRKILMVQQLPFLLLHGVDIVKELSNYLMKKVLLTFEVDVEEYNISKRKLKEIGIEDFFVPQIFVDGVPIGGFSDLKKIFGSDMPVPKVS